MNNWNSIEEQLASWQPRRPSRRVEQALFGQAETPSQRHAAPRSALHLSWQSGWAAGLGTCLVLAFTLLNLTHSNALSGHSSVIVPALVSNASYAASFAALEHNCVSAVSAPVFDSTKAAPVPLTPRSLDSFNTNDLLP